MNNIWDNKELIKILQQGGLAVMPTDTVYGIVGRAEDALVVESVYQARQRSPEKPCIILIGDISELEKFSINLTEVQKEKLKEYWPGPVSIILDCANDKFEYLHRGTDTLACRLPAQEELRKFLLETGPLIAPSANTEGSPVAKNVDEAKKYFRDQVDFYMDGGEIQGNPSRVIRLSKAGEVSIIRE